MSLSTPPQWLAIELRGEEFELQLDQVLDEMVSDPISPRTAKPLRVVLADIDRAMAVSEEPTPGAEPGPKAEPLAGKAWLADEVGRRRKARNIPKQKASFARELHAEMVGAAQRGEVKSAYATWTVIERRLRDWKLWSAR